MNERTEALAKQAADYAIEFAVKDQAQYIPKLMEKFAELMVKKFDDILLLEYLDCIGNQYDQDAMRIQLLRARVKVYFGVEE